MVPGKGGKYVYISESGYCLMLIVFFKYSTLAPETLVLEVLSDFSSMLLFEMANNLCDRLKRHLVVLMAD